jgi:hypothetical protein
LASTDFLVARNLSADIPGLVGIIHLPAKSARLELDVAGDIRSRLGFERDQLAVAFAPSVVIEGKDN